MNPEHLQLRDITPPIPPSVHPLVQMVQEQSTILIVASIIVLIVAAAFVFFRLGKKKGSLISAHEKALADLFRARSLMTPDSGLQYADKLSDILRQYIEKRLHIKTTQQTTKEFFTGLIEKPNQTAILLEDHCESLQECLEKCDMAKFACCVPDLNSMEKMETSVHDFIEATRESKEGSK
jgi:hypothetical protein